MAANGTAGVGALGAFLHRIVPELLGDPTGVIAEATADAGRLLTRYVSDANQPLLVITRTTRLTADGHAGSKGEEQRLRNPFQFSLRLDYEGSDRLAMAVLKNSRFNPKREVGPQLSVLKFPEGAPFGSIYTMVHLVLAPYLRSAAVEENAEDKIDMRTVNRAIADMEFSLMHFEDGVSFQTVDFAIHPVIEKAVSEAEAQNRVATPNDLGSIAEDQDFLDGLQNMVQRWTRDIQKLTTMERDSSQGSASQEMSFWLGLDRALQSVQKQRESQGVELTLEVLRSAKRYTATLNFDSESGLPRALDTTHNYAQFFRDFPISQLTSAENVESIVTAIYNTFGHLRKIRNTAYPVTRAVHLVTALNRDVCLQIFKLLDAVNLIDIPNDDFHHVLHGCQKIFATFDGEEERIRTTLMEMKQEHPNSEDIIVHKSYNHLELRNRLNDIGKFRDDHERLVKVLTLVFTPKELVVVDESLTVTAEDLEAFGELTSAYEGMKDVDSKDISIPGQEAWQEALDRYNKRILAVEARLVARLKAELALAGNASEMFRTLLRFRPLYSREGIYNTVFDHQGELIRVVRDEVHELQNVHSETYENSMNSYMSGVRDIPAYSRQILHGRQLERQVDLMLAKLTSVLDRGWEKKPNGVTLMDEVTQFKAALDPEPVIDQWAYDVKSAEPRLHDKVFIVEFSRGQDRGFQLGCNYIPILFDLDKEVRNMKGAGCRVPVKINAAHGKGKLVYPLATSLRVAVSTYNGVMEKLKLHEVIRALVQKMHQNIQRLIGEGARLTWDDFRLADFSKQFSDAVAQFADRVNDALDIADKISKRIASIKTCRFTKPALRAVVGGIQELVDELHLRGYTNLHKWVAKQNLRVEKFLVKRLDKEIGFWVRKLHHPADTTDAKTGQPLPDLSVATHEIVVLHDQGMRLEPPADVAKEHMVRELKRHLGQVTELPRLNPTRYALKLSQPLLERSSRNYKDLLVRMNAQGLEDAYAAIDGKSEAIAAYEQQWTKYQALWDMSTNDILARLGDDLGRWERLLLEIKTGKVDQAGTSRSFGAVEVDFAQAQVRINMKYDALHKEVQLGFGEKLGTAIKDFHATLREARGKLEQVNLDAATTQEAIRFLMTLQDLKRNVGRWKGHLAQLESGEETLRKQRYRFPAEWLYTENLTGEWTAFNDILRRKDHIMKSQTEALQMQVVQEHRAIEQRLAALADEWENNKPEGEDVSPEDAQAALRGFEERFLQLQEDYGGIALAHEALDLDFAADDRIGVHLAAVQSMQASWDELAKTWAALDELKTRPWSAVVPKKLRGHLEDIMMQLKNLPARVRGFSSYAVTENQIQEYLSHNKVIGDLKTDALKDRHYDRLFKLLGGGFPADRAALTLGHLYAAPLKANEKGILRILSEAQGEMALQEFLKEIKEVWTAYELELIGYQKKTMLVKGWDDLFNQCKEHLNSLQAMKGSPFYKAFEEEANAWDDRLNAISDIFDLWMDVQRRWVYLEGIFTGSADLKQLLPTETTRFTSISQEFLGLMKRTSKNPMVIDVIGFPDVLKLLERLADLLTKIQKALGEYLEKERAAFPRFYFVGDEDLLDIIGNSKNVDRIQKHFKKMFAGVTKVMVNEDGTEALGVASKEGEEVPFFTPVTVKGEKINVWLTNVEKQMRIALGKYLAQCVQTVDEFRTNGFALEPYLAWLDQYQAQLVVLGAQVAWSTAVENALTKMAGGASDEELKHVVASVEKTLNALADTVLLHQPPIRRRKLEHMITELVHQRDVTRDLIRRGVSSPKDFEWLQMMRFFFDPAEPDPLKQLTIIMADAKFYYGFEYLGLVDKLVQTPLTDRCFLTMTQAIDARQGGAPFGPAGTGKTESVKALGIQLGRFVLVFNCDETFDAHAMGRIFIGLCQVGAWGCFDEFNRLEERMLSAVSQQIQSIQLALKAGPTKPGKPIMAELGGKTIPVSGDMACFITMNPGYAGRSALPENLKKLFRNLAMTKPDRQLIAQVMLYSQGFRDAEKLARKIVPLFTLCKEQLSAQTHYDFGLRSLKSVLVSSGNNKRRRLAAARQAVLDAGEDLDEGKISASIDEQEVVIESVTQTMVPKLVAEDLPLLASLMQDVFPGVDYRPVPLEDLRRQVVAICEERHLLVSDMFLTKIMQLYQVSNINHGLMLVGPAGGGKSTAWRVLLEALQRLEGVEGCSYVLDPKAIVKDELYGFMDNTTREWTDGLLTHIIRKIIDNHRGEQSKRQWVIFDGDVDPEWVENLNSVLDDNKLLTLPNGERLSLPPCIRIIFEVKDLKHATLATVSRCGMVWFSESVLTLDMVFGNYLGRLRADPLLEDTFGLSDEQLRTHPILDVQRQVADILEPHLGPGGVVAKTLDFSATLDHVMRYSNMRALNALFSMLSYIPRAVFQYNDDHPDFPMRAPEIAAFAEKRLAFSIAWACVGDSRAAVRKQLSEFVATFDDIEMPEGDIIDYEVTLPEGRWSAWRNKVPVIELDSSNMAGTNVVVPTLDTVRHEDVLYTWLKDHLPIVLCGPPGSGKTMTLFSALRALPNMEVAGLNFSSTTTPELILKTLDQYCKPRKTPSGTVMAPVQNGKWLVIFCDECNLSAADDYETVRVVTFMRQLVEQNGYWDTADHSWVSLERIQFVGACNPPTDPGRVPLDSRFLRHVPVVYVDYPTAESYKMIYGTFVRAMLRPHAMVADLGDAMTEAMVDFFMQTQDRFTADMQAHYIYSPREMTRWVKGIGSSMPKAGVTSEALVRLWAHEALRLFQDRLVFEEERRWTNENIDAVARRYFAGADLDAALRRPILYSTWLTGAYESVGVGELRAYVQGRLRVFCEEELDVELVLFDELLDHILRIDRIFRQNQGHMLLIGVSGCGRTTLSKFVAWLNDLLVFQVKVHNRYSAADFDADLRGVLRRAGTEGEKMVFIVDGDNLNDTAFLERLNTLLANGEVPGLFEGDEYAALMTACKDAAARGGEALEGNEELYKWFSNTVMDNLHVVFTMNGPENGLGDTASASPALFNRCVLDWFGDWSQEARYTVANEFLAAVDVDRDGYVAPATLARCIEALPPSPSHRLAVANACLFVHGSARRAARRMQKREGRSTHITPRHFVDFIGHVRRIFTEKRGELEEEKHHLEVGLAKIKETVEQVSAMQEELAVKGEELVAKEAEAQEKLKQMMVDQRDAEAKKVQSEELSKVLKVKQAEAATKKGEVMQDLSRVEPAVREAAQAVGGIKKKHLQEIKALGKPPDGVRLALEATCTLLREKKVDWKSIRQIIGKDDFVPRVKGFDSESITAAISRRMQPFLDNPDFTFDKVNRASQAAGPLVKWCRAQCLYSEMLHKVEPLRNELGALEAAAAQMESEFAANAALIGRLEEKIGQYEREYAQLVGEAQSIKVATASVQEKVRRSVQLLESLSDERERWSASTAGFAAQMETLVGDAVLCGGFMAYSGYFDQNYRRAMFAEWQRHLGAAGIVAKRGLSIPDYLSTPDERLRWKQHELPEDELCTENAIMLKRYGRYPLIIDPSGQATKFIVQEHAGSKLTSTSFLNKDFKKHLETALRFGTPLLVHDSESFDAIINPVLNREVRKANGRVLVALGDSEIDLSPAFRVIMASRNPAVQFAPDLTSRTTLVNFTVTRGSLQSQCLSLALRAERPDVDRKRSDLMKLQGEFRVRLHTLEKDLLAALNQAQGSILDDNRVIAQLETIKKDAGEVQAKVAETDKVMRDVETTSQFYAPLAHRCSAIFFTLQQAFAMHFLYRYSLRFFMDVYDEALTNNPRLAGVTDHAARRAVIAESLFEMVFSRVAPGMLNEHRLPLAMTFAGFQLHSTRDELAAAELQHFLTGGVLHSGATDFDALVPARLTPEQAAQAHVLAHSLDVFAGLPAEAAANEAAFVAWARSARPEDAVPPFLSGAHDGGLNGSDTVRSFRQLLLLQALRPDRVKFKCASFCEAVFSPAFLAEDRDLALVIERQVDAKTPVLLCGASGYDPSTNVYDVANELKKQVTMIAIGSAEGFKQAENSLASLARSGQWLLLTNVHLAPQWLVTLEKSLSGLTPSPSFRIFLTSEINPKLPVNLLRSARIFVYEPAAGVKANLIRTLNTFPEERVNAAPAQRGRMYLLLAWLHAVIQERIRYVPLGWSKVYEFGEPDLRTCADTIDRWVDSVADDRAQIDPAKIPWEAIRMLVSSSIYGGRIDNFVDARLLMSFLDSLFTERSFDVKFPLVKEHKESGTEPIYAPEGVKLANFIQWVGTLPDAQSPTWLGLPANAEMVLLTKQATVMVMNMCKLQTTDDGDDDEEAPAAGDEGGAAAEGAPDASAIPTWMRQVLAQIAEWKKVLPAELPTLERTPEKIKDPMFRYFEREVTIGSKLLTALHCDLEEIKGVCYGDVKQTNHHRELLAALAKGFVPKPWDEFTVPKGLGVGHWVADFARRVEQLQTFVDAVVSGRDLRAARVWLGGLFNPEAYITATRQAVAQANAWSLERLQLELEFRKGPGDLPANMDNSFALSDLRLDGATCAGAVIELVEEPFAIQTLVVLRWVNRDPSEARASHLVELPVYLNTTRDELIVTCFLEPAAGKTWHAFYERGVAFMCSGLAGMAA